MHNGYVWYLFCYSSLFIGLFVCFVKGSHCIARDGIRLIVAHQGTKSADNLSSCASGLTGVYLSHRVIAGSSGCEKGISKQSSDLGSTSTS